MSTRRPDPAVSPARGAVLVAIAVILGLVLIQSGLDTDVSSGSDARTARPTSTTAAATSSTSAVRSPAQTTVLVANASGVDGAAGRMTTTIKSKGYNTAAATNARANVSTTAIYYISGFKAEAERVAGSIGAPASSVKPMPAPAPVANLGGAHVLIVLGPDLAPKG